MLKTWLISWMEQHPAATETSTRWRTITIGTIALEYQIECMVPECNSEVIHDTLMEHGYIFKNGGFSIEG